MSKQVYIPKSKGRLGFNHSQVACAYSHLGIILCAWRVLVKLVCVFFAANLPMLHAAHQRCLLSQRDCFPQTKLELKTSSDFETWIKQTSGRESLSTCHLIFHLVCCFPCAERIFIKRYQQVEGIAAHAISCIMDRWQDLNYAWATRYSWLMHSMCLISLFDGKARMQKLGFMILARFQHWWWYTLACICVVFLIA